MKVYRKELHKASRSRGKGQAVVEMALMGLFLGMMLAAAIDLGRAFYTLSVVTNMAGEGAAYAALYPDQDRDPLRLVESQSCSVLSVPADKNIQQRARRIAKDRGLVIEQGDQDAAEITISTYSFGSSCNVRCAGRTVTVTVKYKLNDLFLPGFLGFSEIPITRSASQVILRDVARNASCSDDDDD